MTKPIDLVRFFCVALTATATACGAGAPTTPNADAPAPLVQLVTVTPTGEAGAIRASGLVGYRRETELAFTAPGVVATLHVDAGDRVRRGQRLATLRRTTAGANVDEAALARANAERDLARTQELYERGFVSEARLEDARLAVERARDSSVLSAPADGVILRRRAEQAQSVGAGTPIFSFGETGSGIVVRAPVASTAAARVRVGDTVTALITDLAGESRQGRVARIGAQGNQLTGAFEVEVAIARSEGLRSGMVAALEIAAAPGAIEERAILVPTLSLLDARADQGVVYVVDAQGVAHRRRVRTSGITQDGVLVVDGLTGGDRIVAVGAAYVRDGQPVRIVGED
ncbi:MAG: efflux RND transporter periplasmic adaptor subunit [Hyphomonadaceae bacterium]|nr:efflux RND transporter periplasmic adaptor subunit [Hyphomonadaceae bacterium]